LESLDSYDEVRQHISGLRDIAAETLETVHDLALELRPSVLDDLGLAVALERYLSDYQRRFDIAADYRTIGLAEHRLAPAIETTLYRIVQEALTNVVRHSAATHVSVLLEQTSQHVRVIVEDNGSGFDTSTIRQERNLGLYGMEERATLIDGSLRIEAEPGMGTTIVVHVPLSETLVDRSPLEQITTPKIASVVENRAVRGVT
jgi:signal transduction histidine kinase